MHSPNDSAAPEVSAEETKDQASSAVASAAAPAPESQTENPAQKATTPEASPAPAPAENGKPTGRPRLQIILSTEVEAAFRQEGDGSGEGESFTDEFSFSDRMSKRLLEDVAWGLGRTLTMEDVTRLQLFGWDETAPKQENCFGCETQFRPRHWAFVKDGKTVPDRYEPERPLFSGNYLVIRQRDWSHRIFPFCNDCIEDARRTGFDKDGNEFRRQDPLPTMILSAAERYKAEAERNQQQFEDAEKAKKSRFARAFGFNPNDKKKPMKTFDELKRRRS